MSNNIYVQLSSTKLFSYRSTTEAVPGCPGQATSGVDFCARRPSEDTVWLNGDNGSPAANFPLGLCEGDCDVDADCQSGLIW